MTASLRRTALILTAAALAASLGGCYWPMPGQGPNRAGYNAAERTIRTANVTSLHNLWTADLDAGPAGDPVTSTAAVHVNGGRTHYALSPATGQTRWSFTPARPLTPMQPVVDGDVVLAPRWNRTASARSDQGEDVTLRLDSATGSPAGAALPGQPIAVRGRLGLFWDVGLSGGPTASFWDGLLKVRDLDTGEVLCCDRDFASYSEQPPPPDPEPLTLGSRWILHAGEGTNNPADPTSGFGNGVRGYKVRDAPGCPGAGAFYVCPEWAAPLNGTEATAPVLSADESVVYVGTNASTVYAVQTGTGTVLWSTFVSSRVTAPPALAGGRLYVPTYNRRLIALDAASGAIQWESDGGAGITTQPAVANGLVFTGSADGKVQAFTAAGCGTFGCSARWSYDAGSAITGAPAVSLGHVYAGTADGRVLAFGP